MNIKPIVTEQDYQDAMAEIKTLWDAPPNTPEGDKLDALVTLAVRYEEIHFPMGNHADPIDMIEFVMDQNGLTRKDLEQYIGSKGRVSEIMNRKRPLTLNMIRKLSKGLKIPVELLISMEEEEQEAA